MEGYIKALKMKKCLIWIYLVKKKMMLKIKNKWKNCVYNCFVKINKISSVGQNYILNHYITLDFS